MTSASPAEKQRLVFLPGASGDREFWRPAARSVADLGECVFEGWPGFGGAPPAPTFCGTDDLVRQIVDDLHPNTHLFAQSMGGVVGLLAALARPHWVRSLVLSVTSGGLDLEALGARDWRETAIEWMPPGTPAWFLEEKRCLRAEIPRLRMPVLLVWGDSDPLSPLAVAHELKRILPQARTHVVAGAGHDVVHSHAAEVGAVLRQHLTTLAT